MSHTGFNTPTLTEIIDRAKGDINANVEGADARLRRSVIGVLATILAGGVKGLYDYNDWVSDQSNVLYADAENLDLWGSLWGVERKLATKATGDITFTGTNGTVVAVGVEVQRADGFKYIVTTGGTVAAGTVTVTVEANEAGIDGNALVGVQTTLVSPITGLDSTGTVVSITGGADTEIDGINGSTEDYRGRILARIQSPPNGGSENDYIAWALEVAGVTDAFVYPLALGAGTVVVRFMMYDTYPDGIPLAADVATVQAYIDDVSRRPVTDNFTAVAPTAKVQNITITSLSPDTAEIRAAIEAELADMIRREAIPGGTIRLSKIWEAISVAQGESSHTLTAPSADVTTTTGEIVTLGTVSYV